MDCGDVHNLLHPYLDGELDLVRTLDVERHLGECPACAQARDQQQALRVAIRRGSLYHEAPALLRESGGTQDEVQLDPTVYLWPRAQRRRE